MQDCWHQWHQSFNASSISGLPAATQQLHLTAGVLDGHTVTLAGRAPKAQQLQLAARHMAGYKNPSICSAVIFMISYKSLQLLA